ncbi:Protodermal factor 1 [Zea mays]|uniref:Protodermal factor 1 n=1 Tax=Zea mays TaxID=4577 RepID=A0A1D6MHD2_MAIZE|nr:Protodermal factor 1 [Zea mays]
MEAWRSLLASFVLAVLAAQALVAVVESRTGPVEQASEGDDVKKPDCVPGMDPRSFPGTGGGHGITPVTPSHGGSGSSPTSPSTGGGAYGGSPSTPGGGAYGGSPPSTPSGGGAYGGSPSTPSAAQLHDPRRVPLHHGAGPRRFRGGGGGRVRRRGRGAGGGLPEGQRGQGVAACAVHMHVWLISWSAPVA